MYGCASSCVDVALFLVLVLTQPYPFGIDPV